MNELHSVFLLYYLGHGKGILPAKKFTDAGCERLGNFLRTQANLQLVWKVVD